MKKHFLTSVLFFSLCLYPAFGQTIKFDLPDQKGNTLHIIANKGLQKDTIFSKKIDEKGGLIFTPTKDNPVSSGVLSLFIEPETKFDLMYSPTENIIIHYENVFFQNQNFKVSNSPENDFINTHFPEQMFRLEKMKFCGQGLQMFDESSNLSVALTEEMSNIEKQLTAFDSILQDNSAKLFSARYMLLQSLMTNTLGRFQNAADYEEISALKNNAIFNVDTETLYRSGAWYNFINGLLGLYQKDSPFFGQFGTDMSVLMQRTESQEVFLALANDAATICAQFGWNNDEIIMSKYLILVDRIPNPQGKLRQMLIQYKFEPGMPAPKIAISENQYVDFQKNKTLVVFYESGCTLCENEMSQLIKDYSILKEKGIEIVSISSDLDKTIFENSSKNFPWQHKLCDLKGFSGENFNNYAIIGTPTLFLIDNDEVILGKYASLSEIIDSL